MAWQDVANAELQGEAPGVIDVLQRVGGGYDFSDAIRNLAREGRESGDAGWFDPSRDAPASVAFGVVRRAAELELNPARASALSSLASGTVNELRLQQVDAIQREQASHGGDSFGRLLKLAALAGTIAIGAPELGAAFGASADAGALALAAGESTVTAAAAPGLASWELELGSAWEGAVGESAAQNAALAASSSAPGLLSSLQTASTVANTVSSVAKVLSGPAATNASAAALASRPYVTAPASSQPGGLQLLVLPGATKSAAPIGAPAIAGGAASGGELVLVVVGVAVAIGLVLVIKTLKG